MKAKDNLWVVMLEDARDRGRGGDFGRIPLMQRRNLLKQSLQVATNAIPLVALFLVVCWLVTR